MFHPEKSGFGYHLNINAEIQKYAWIIISIVMFIYRMTYMQMVILIILVLLGIQIHICLIIT